MYQNKCLVESYRLLYRHPHQIFRKLRKCLNCSSLPCHLIFVLYMVEISWYLVESNWYLDHINWSQLTQLVFKAIKSEHGWLQLISSKNGRVKDWMIHLWSLKVDYIKFKPRLNKKSWLRSLYCLSEVIVNIFIKWLVITL